MSVCLLYVNVYTVCQCVKFTAIVDNTLDRKYVFFVIKLVINCVRLDSESSFTTYFQDLKHALKGAICIYETVIITLFLDVSVILCLQIF